MRTATRIVLATMKPFRLPIQSLSLQKDDKKGVLSKESGLTLELVGNGLLVSNRS